MHDYMVSSISLFVIICDFYFRLSLKTSVSKQICDFGVTTHQLKKQYFSWIPYDDLNYFKGCWITYLVMQIRHLSILRLEIMRCCSEKSKYKKMTINFNYMHHFSSDTFKYAKHMPITNLHVYLESVKSQILTVNDLTENVSDQTKLSLKLSLCWTPLCKPPTAAASEVQNLHFSVKSESIPISP